VRKITQDGDQIMTINLDNGHNFLVSCNSCKSEFECFYDMDENHYIIAHCVFCGSEISEDEVERIDDEEDMV